jgi:hypothetical protein
MPVHTDYGGVKMTLSVLQKIEHLDARQDHQEIIRLTTAYEYPFLMQKALEFALFRTYAVPSIIELLTIPSISTKKVRSATMTLRS